MSPDQLPAWAREMREMFRAGTTSQFVISRQRLRPRPRPRRQGRRRVRLAHPLPHRRDVHAVRRGHPLRPRQGDPGAEGRRRTSTASSRCSTPSRARRGRRCPTPAPTGSRRSTWAACCRATPSAPSSSSTASCAAALARTRVEGGKNGRRPAQGRRHPRLRPLHRAAGRAALRLRPVSQTLIQLLDWSSDPAITGAFVATVLITENLADLNRGAGREPLQRQAEGQPADGRRAARLHRVSHPRRRRLRDGQRGDARRARRQAGRPVAGQRAQPGPAGAVVEGADHRQVPDGDEEGAHREGGVRPPGVPRVARGRSTTSPATSRPRRGCGRTPCCSARARVTRAIPMGYLLTGRIGTGKTYLVECLAGEIGVPCVELKNFREKWVGATEGNLEKVFSILHALGQVIVFVDEADQATGKRGGGDGDSGLSGRIYAMMAKEMSDTKNRGKIIWIFATSRPDLLEVDLKRQGRLDVHIPLFPPGDAEGRRTLFAAMARKLKMAIKPEELPRCPTTTRSAATRWRASWSAPCACTRPKPTATPQPADRSAGRQGSGQPRPGRTIRCRGEACPRPTEVAARVHRGRDRRLPAVGAHRAPRADGHARGQGVHRRPLPPRALPLALDRRRQRPHRPPQARHRRVARPQGVFRGAGASPALSGYADARRDHAVAVDDAELEADVVGHRDLLVAQQDGVVGLAVTVEVAARP